MSVLSPRGKGETAAGSDRGRFGAFFLEPARYPQGSPQPGTGEGILEKGQWPPGLRLRLKHG